MRDRAVGLALGALAAATVAGSHAVDAVHDAVEDVWPPAVVAILALLVAFLSCAAGLLVLTRFLPERGRRSSRSGPLGMPVVLPLVLGAALITARIALGGLASPSGGSLSFGPGPWQAVVVSIGTPHDGRQSAVLGLDVSGSPRVAASLPRFPAVVPGDRVTVDGRLEPPADGSYGDYLRRSRLVGSLRAVAVVRDGAADGALPGLEGLRRSGSDALARVLPEPEAGLAAGILIGLRDRVDRAVSSAFTTAGVTHVVAISGWNIAIVAAAVAALTGRWRRRRRAAVTLVAIACYTVIAGASASVVRAAAMAGVVSLAREGGRGIRASTALAWAVVGLLAVDPATAVDPGFQLSALATAGLIAWATPLAAWLGRLGGGRLTLPVWLAESLGVSLAAQAATLPLVLVLFGRMSVVAPAVNLAVVPLVPASMAAGLIALGAGLGAAAGVPDPIASVAAIPAWLLLTAMIRIVDVAAAMPLASLTLGAPGSYAAAGVSAAIVLAASRHGRVMPTIGRALAGLRGSSQRVPAVPTPGGPSTGPGSAASSRRNDARRRPAARPPGGATAHLRRLRRPLLALAVVVLAVSLAAAERPDGRSHLTMLDVGQGDAILIESPQGGRLLVDGGPDADRLLRLLDGRLPPWDHRLDLVVLTHPHEDHVGGLPLVLGRYRIGRVFEPGFPGDGPGYAAFLDALRARGLRSERLAAGSRLQLDEIEIRVLWPDASTIPSAMPDTGRGVNDLSIVLLADVDGRRVLLGGDAEDDVDPVLVGRGLPHVELLKVSHHGSRTSTSDALLAAVAPSVALISVGARNDYGHPSPATLDRLAAHGAEVHRTDLEGSIEVTFGPASLTVATERRVGRAGALLYHPVDVGSRADRGRLPPALPRPAAVVPPAFARRRGGRGLARHACASRRRSGRSVARRGRGPPARRRQARGAGPGDSASAARRGVGDLAGAPRAPRARWRRRGPSCHATPRCRRLQAMAGDRGARGADRRLRRQAGRSATRADGCAVRILGQTVPGR